MIAGRFSLEREIGRGASAVIYLARDATLGRPVAIKLLNPETAANQDLRQRFLREARTAGVLSQPNIVPIHAVEREEALAVINELEAHIGTLRAERDAVDLRLEPGNDGIEPAPFPRLKLNRSIRATLAGHDPRLSVNRRIEVAIAALEAIRLDLVHIRSGVGSHEDLKSDLKVARRRAAGDTNQLTLSMEKQA